MNALLRVHGGRSLSETDTSLEFDEFLPLQFRTFRESLGAGFLRLGNLSTTLLELTIEPTSQVLRGFSVTSYDLLSPWPSFSLGPPRGGLPVMATQFDGWGVVSLNVDFEVSTSHDEIVIWWSDLGSCEALTCDRVRFLVRGEFLVGISICDLSQAELDRFLSHSSADRR